jgi:hypothetical protein
LIASTDLAAGNEVGITGARKCALPLCSAHLCAGLICGTMGMPWWRNVDAFRGVKGSPVQIRPSRLVRVYFRTQKQDCGRLMGAQRAPISSMNPAVVRRAGDITPLASGPAEPTQRVVATRAHLSAVKRPPVHIVPSRLVLGNIRRDAVAAPADAVSPAARYIKRTVLRALIAIAGWTRATVIRATGPELVPNLRICGLLGHAKRSTCADATRGCPESTHGTKLRPVHIP